MKTKIHGLSKLVKQLCYLTFLPNMFNFFRFSFMNYSQYVNVVINKYKKNEKVTKTFLIVKKNGSHFCKPSFIYSSIIYSSIIFLSKKKSIHQTFNFLNLNWDVSH